MPPDAKAMMNFRVFTLAAAVISGLCILIGGCASSQCTETPITQPCDSYVMRGETFEVEADQPDRVVLQAVAVVRPSNR